MQWLSDLFYNIIFKIICAFFYVLWYYILWPPIYHYAGIYLKVKDFVKWNFIDFAIAFEHEILYRRPRVFWARVFVFVFHFVANGFYALPKGLICELLVKPMIRRYHLWCKKNSELILRLRIYWRYKHCVASRRIKKTRKYIYAKYIIVKRFFLDTGFTIFMDYVVKEKYIYRQFVFYRTIFFKVSLFYVLFSRNFMSLLHGFIFENNLPKKNLLNIVYLDFDSYWVFFNIFASLTHPNLLYAAIIVFGMNFFSSKIFFNFDEFVVFWNLEFASECSLYIEKKKLFVNSYHHFDLFFHYFNGYLKEFLSIFRFRDWIYYACNNYNNIWFLIAVGVTIYVVLFVTNYLCHVLIYYGLLRLGFYTLDNLVQFISDNYIETPFFFFTGFLFFLTVLASWFFYSFLSLYGLFKLNLISLFFFWISLIIYIKPIFLHNTIYNIKLSNWLSLNNNTVIEHYFYVDSVSFSFILLTTTIAFFVYIYAFSYFRYEPLVDRFLLFLLSFVISMIFLVSSGNLIMIFLGWELIGLTSFLLINFWTTKTATLKSAFKAFSFNKVSDFFLYIFIIATYNIYHTVDVQVINHLVYKNQNVFICFNGFSVNSLEFLAFMLLSASFIKSAQIGGHIWLPDSMEAPVPASALIHSATLVSAGIYLILRFNFLFDYTYYPKLILPIVGSLTAAYGGVCALTQTDLKKTLAYSTISHCGFLMVLCSTEMNEFVILYLYVHGFFKAILFMCVGNILRLTNGYQDFRRMGGFFKYLPFEYYCSVVCVFNLAGLPFTFGFFAKHLIFISLNSNMCLYYITLFNSIIGALSGLFYSFGLLKNVFFGLKRADKCIYTRLSRKKNFSFFYTNSSVASILSIFSLLIVSIILILYIYKYMLSANFLFSDYTNTIAMNNYYAIVSSNFGFNLNYFYTNSIILIVVTFILFKKKKKSQYIDVYFNRIFSIIFILLSLLILLL